MEWLLFFVLRLFKGCSGGEHIFTSLAFLFCWLTLFQGLKITVFFFPILRRLEHLETKILKVETFGME